MKKYSLILAVSIFSASIIYFLIKQNGFIDYQQSLSEYNNLKTIEYDKQIELNNLKKEVILLQTNKNYKESHLRDEFFVKPNEKIIVIK